MSYQEEEQSRLRRQSTKRAIDLAVQGNWREAIAVNQGILGIFPGDVEALNRLGRAYMEMGQYDEAEAAYRRTAEIDPYNAIAARNLQRLSHLRGARDAIEIPDRLESRSFIEEVGKAGVVQLVALARPEVLARTAAGDRVHLRVDGAELIAETVRGDYLGSVGAPHGPRLVRLMEGGNRYFAAIVSSTTDAVSVIIREVYQDPGQAGRPSFPSGRLADARTDAGERAIRGPRDQEAPPESGYTVVGAGEEAEVLIEDSVTASEDSEDE